MLERQVHPVAVDIPSGIHADTGRMGIALKADVTVTFGYEKWDSFSIRDALTAAVVVADIGFPPVSLERLSPELFTYEAEDIRMIPARPAYSIREPSAVS